MDLPWIITIKCPTFARLNRTPLHLNSDINTRIRTSMRRQLEIYENRTIIYKIIPKNQSHCHKLSTITLSHRFFTRFLKGNSIPIQFCITSTEILVKGMWTFTGQRNIKLR